MKQLISSLRVALMPVALVIAVSTAFAAGDKADTRTGADPAIVEFLLASSAKDFKASGANPPTGIRAARIGFYSESGRGNYVLCGSFKAGVGSQAKWTPFATIKTLDYEQWLGGNARAYCGQRAIKWFAGDHSAALAKRLAP